MPGRRRRGTTGACAGFWKTGRGESGQFAPRRLARSYLPADDGREISGVLAELDHHRIEQGEWPGTPRPRPSAWQVGGLLPGRSPAPCGEAPGAIVAQLVAR